jgi:hypothetical protein
MPLQNSELLTDMMVEWAASAAATSTIASTRTQPGPCRAAVFGRHFDAHQAVLAQQADVVQRELAGAVMVLRAGAIFSCAMRRATSCSINCSSVS